MAETIEERHRAGRSLLGEGDAAGALACFDETLARNPKFAA